MQQQVVTRLMDQEDTIPMVMATVDITGGLDLDYLGA